MVDGEREPPVMTDDQLVDLEAGNALDEQITVQVSRPMKWALTWLSARLHLSVADLIRMSVQGYLPEQYPEYTNLYYRALTEAKPKPIPKNRKR